MANVNTPKGFECWGPCLRANEYTTSAIVYPGDLVKLGSDGLVSPATAGDANIGPALTYAASGATVLVADDPSQEIACQADETEISAQTLIGNMADIVATAGNATYKTSRQQLDSSTASASQATLQILRLEGTVGNAFGAQAKVVCRINEHQLAQGSGIAGV